MDAALLKEIFIFIITLKLIIFYFNLFSLILDIKLDIIRIKIKFDKMLEIHEMWNAKINHILKSPTWEYECENILTTKYKLSKMPNWEYELLSSLNSELAKDFEKLQDAAKIEEEISKYQWMIEFFWVWYFEVDRCMHDACMHFWGYFHFHSWSHYYDEYNTAEHGCMYGHIHSLTHAVRHIHEI